jgi:hypothetical protein
MSDSQHVSRPALTIGSFALCISLVFASVALAQSSTDANTAIVESAYQILPAYGQKYRVKVVIVAINPFEDKFAARPNVRVTLRGADNSIIRTQEVNSAGIPPKHKIAFTGELYADELPAKVEFRPLDARYEATIFRPSDFRPFELLNLRAGTDGTRMRVTGEIKNPYPLEAGAWITFLFRDASGKLLGGHTKYEHTIPAGEPTPFEFYIDIDDVPPEMKSIEKIVFSHNNYQDSWQKLLRR